MASWPIIIPRPAQSGQADQIAMDINPLETTEPTQTEAPAPVVHRRLNAMVAITVALLATFMGVCKVKDDNIVQNMQQAQANKLDHWNFYQARNIREEVANATLVQLRLAAELQPPSNRAGYDKAIAHYEQLAAEQNRKKEELKAQAEQDQRDYDKANFHDDQFDLSDALLAIAISLLAVTALTQLLWMYWLALVPTAFGLAMGLAGLTGGNLHPDLLIRLLS